MADLEPHVDKELIQNENLEEDIKEEMKMHNEVPLEGPASLELNLFKSPKTWKKSITRFFRNQIRSTRSNEGDAPSGSTEHFTEDEIRPEQKWQSLGKMFRRQHQGASGATDDHEKKSVRKVLSSYFAKNPKTLPTVSDENKN